jgi:hypothetical protein
VPTAPFQVMMCPSTKKPSAKGTGKHPHRVRKLQAEALTLQEQVSCQGWCVSLCHSQLSMHSVQYTSIHSVQYTWAVDAFRV